MSHLFLFLPLLIIVRYEIIAPAENPSINVLYMFKTFMLKLERGFVGTLA
jgi:hypothetical protein